MIHDVNFEVEAEDVDLACCMASFQSYRALLVANSEYKRLWWDELMNQKSNGRET